METITGDMVINEVIRKDPATIKVFNDYRVDSCCGGGAPIELTARRDGVDVDGLVRALNAAVEGPQAGAAPQKQGGPALRRIEVRGDSPCPHSSLPRNFLDNRMSGLRRYQHKLIILKNMTLQH